jgi:hypothetical protein
VDYPFASVMRDPDSNPQGDTYVKPVFSWERCLATSQTWICP